jgi:adenosylhomocysteinase
VNEHKSGIKLASDVHDIPFEQDQEIARVKIATLGYSIDVLTEEQVKYMNDYSAGT